MDVDSGCSMFCDSTYVLNWVSISKDGYAARNSSNDENWLRCLSVQTNGNSLIKPFLRRVR